MRQSADPRKRTPRQGRSRVAKQPCLELSPIGRRQVPIIRPSRASPAIKTGCRRTLDRRRSEMKRFVLAAAMVGLTMGSASAANIGVTMANSDTFLTVLRNAIESYGKEKGAALTIEIADDDVNKQTSQIENFIAAKVDAIIVNAVDTSATPKMTKLAADAGIPLVYVNRQP